MDTRARWMMMLSALGALAGGACGGAHATAPGSAAATRPLSVPLMLRADGGEAEVRRGGGDWQPLEKGKPEGLASEVRAGMTVGKVNAILRRYYEDVGLWETPGWGLGYELGLSLPPDWVGEFYFNVRDDQYLDRVFEENMVTNYESIFNTALIDTVVFERDGVRILGRTPREIFSVG